MRTLPFLAVAVTATAIAAQFPSYLATPALQPGQNLQTVLLGTPGQSFFSLIDSQGGPNPVAGQTFYLGSNPVTLDVGTLPPTGLHLRSLPTPAGAPVGVPLYLQTVLFDISAPNGLFRLTDGESTVFYNTAFVVVDKFVDPGAQGFSGSFDASVRGRLQGAPVSKRTVRIAPPGHVPFGAGVTGPLNPNGARMQVVLRAGDLAGTGSPELVTAIRWLPFGFVLDETYSRLVIDIAHSTVVPDYTIDPFSALPVYPMSGLALPYAANVKAGTGQVRTYDGPYAILRTNQRPDRYIDFPAPQQPFSWNGFDSLLLDFKMSAVPGLFAFNSLTTNLMVLSAAEPYSRVSAAGTPSQPLDPHQVTVALGGSNDLPDLQVELAVAESDAMSPWHKGPVVNTDWDAPYVAASVPAGASARLEFQGAIYPPLGPQTPWLTSIDGVDGLEWMRYRVILTANPTTGAVPSVDAIVVPAR